MSVDTSTTPLDDAPATTDSESSGQEPSATPSETAEQDTTDSTGTTNSVDSTDSATDSPADGEQAKSKRGRPKGATARKTRTVELTLTVTGTADGEWQAELKHGSKWIARGIEVPAAAVSRAAKELHAELSGPIDEVIDAAREQQQAKVAQLEAELEEAKQALVHLDS